MKPTNLELKHLAAKKQIVKQESFFISVPRANGAKAFELLEQFCSFTIKMQPKKKNVEVEIHSTDPAIISQCHEIAKIYA